MSQQLNASERAVIGADGRARVELGPDVGPPYWTVTKVVVGTSRPGQAPVPSLDLYLDSEDANGWQDTTYDGSRDASEVSIEVKRGQHLIALWSGGQPGDVATLSVSGRKDVKP